FQDGPASALPLTQTLSNIYGRRSASPDVPGSNLDETQKPKFDGTGVEEQLPPPPSPPQLKEAAQLDGVPRLNSVDRILHPDGIPHISHETLNKWRMRARSSKCSPPTFSSLKILTLTAGSMNAVLLRLVTVGKQTFHVTECYNHTGKLKDHYSLNHPQKSLLHPLIDGRDYARSSRDSPEGRAVSLRSVTCNIHDDAPTQSNHYQHDGTPVSAALATITMHSSASKCSTRGRRNPRKDSSGIVSGLRMRPLGGGCSFREVAVWFAPP
ncbi:hypothetical protein G5I_06410, partial [Acromyrmex echinatior]